MVNVAAILDRAISAVSPQRGLIRQADRLRMEQLSQLREEMLSTYAGAERNRTTKDWNPPSQSADRALIPDMELLNNRGRQQRRDSTHGKSARRAFERNTVRTGIRPVPNVRKKDGTPDNEFNDAISEGWDDWAENPLHCDVEKRCSIYRRQRIAVGEVVEVGGHFFVLSYRQNYNPSVGLRVQSYEPEQLDTRSRTDRNGNEIRHGIEIDTYGAPVAYHFYRQHPNDFQRGSLDPVREPLLDENGRRRVLHVADFERARQTHGESRFAPALKKMRNLDQYDEATLMAARLEACIGMIIKKSGSMLDGADYPTGLQVSSSDDRQDANANREISFQPGMIAELMSDEEATAFDPKRPGNNYDPFVTAQCRQIASALGISYEQLVRDFSKGTYSSQRQTMLEDWAEFDLVHQTLSETMLTPLWGEFVYYSVMEGRVPASDYHTNPARYNKVLWTPPERHWIDPEKEMKAIALELLWGLTTRDEVLRRSKGTTFRRIIAAIKAEREAADTAGVLLPDLKGDPKATGTTTDNAPPVDRDEPEETPAKSPKRQGAAA